MRKELEKAGYNSQELIGSNSGLVVDINVMKDNIRVISVQNEELAKALDTFMKANVATRSKVERVAEIADRTE